MPDQLAFSANVPLFCSQGPSSLDLHLACHWHIATSSSIPMAWNWFARSPAVLSPSFLLMHNNISPHPPVAASRTTSSAFPLFALLALRT
jgi:hypothetical protein